VPFEERAMAPASSRRNPEMMSRASPAREDGRTSGSEDRDSHGTSKVKAAASADPRAPRLRRSRTFGGVLHRHGIRITATTSRAPQRAAAMARMPVPVPTSSTRAAAHASRRNRSDSRVVAWLPTPKARFGSITMTSSPGAGSWAIQEGRITRPGRGRSIVK
jgi:hypothetical protein